MRFGALLFLTYISLTSIKLKSDCLSLSLSLSASPIHTRDGRRRDEVARQARDIANLTRRKPTQLLPAREQVLARVFAWDVAVVGDGEEKEENEAGENGKEIRYKSERDEQTARRRKESRHVKANVKTRV